MSRALLPVLLTLAGALAACVPSLDGPQLTDPPRGLGYATTQGEPRGAIGSHAALDERFWASILPPHATVSIVTLDGSVGRDAVAAWRQGLRGNEWTRGELVPVRIDGMDGWSWTDRADESLAMGAVLAGPRTSYSIRISSSRPGERDEERMRAMLRSFRRAPGRLLPWFLALGVGALLALGAWLHSRRDRGSDRGPVIARIEPPPPSPLRTPPAPGRRAGD